MKWSDRFWLCFLKYYAKVMEGMIPFVCPLLFRPREKFYHVVVNAMRNTDWQGHKHRVGLTAIPVGGNAIQMFFTPIIMVGIPKWIRCPPSVMYSLWWTWFTFTLTAYAYLRVTLTKAEEQVYPFLGYLPLCPPSTYH